jgi:hypothetical protein
VTNELRGSQIIIDRGCAADSKVIDGRARAWDCYAVWATGPRVCGARYRIRRLADYSFGSVVDATWDDERLTEIVCA